MQAAARINIVIDSIVFLYKYTYYAVTEQKQPVFVCNAAIRPGHE